MSDAARRSARDVLLDRCVEWFTTHGIGDTSMRTLAAEIGTSQRMLHYHFGSRGDLLSAVVERVVSRDTEKLAQLPRDPADPLRGWEQQWAMIADNAEWLGGLFFEISAHAMYAHQHADMLRRALLDQPLETFTGMLAPSVGHDRAQRLTRLLMAAGRGVIFQLLLDHDRAAADRTMADLIDQVQRAIHQH